MKAMANKKAVKPHKKKLQTMVLSVILALIAWYMVMSLTNPTIKVTVYNLDVRIIGEMELRDKNLVITGRETIPSLSVVVKGSRTDLINYMDDIYVKLDVSNIDSAGEYNLTGSISIPTTRISVERENYGEITVHAEDIVTKEVDVTVNQMGSVDGKIISSEPAVPKVTITGAKSEIDAVSGAVAVDDVTGVKENGRHLVKYLLTNSSGDLITDNETIESPRSEIEIINTVYDAKSLPVSAELSAELRNYYTLNEEKTTVSPESVTVGVTAESAEQSLTAIVMSPEGEQKCEIRESDGIYIPKNSRSVTVNVHTDPIPNTAPPPVTEDENAENEN